MYFLRSKSPGFFCVLRYNVSKSAYIEVVVFKVENFDFKDDYLIS